MWRLTVVVLVVGALVGSAPTRDESGLLQRLKRSPYCPSGPPGPLGPPGPPGPPPPPPPPPPHFHHHHFGANANAQAESGQLQRFTQDQGHNYQEQNQGHSYQGQNFQGQGQNIPCDTCKGQNSAVSNAQSGTGNAVAIAVSKG